MQLILPLAINLLIVVGVCLIGVALALASHRKASDWVWGVVFGVATVLSMATAMEGMSGWFLDYRNVVLALAGFTGGTLTASLAVLISSAYRLLRGGEAMWVGVASILIYTLSGLALRRQVARGQTPTSRTLFFFGLYLGLAKAAVVLASSAVLPMGISVLRATLLPNLILTPLGTVAVFKIFYSLRQRLAAVAMFEAALASMPLRLLLRERPGEWWSLNPSRSSEEREQTVALELEAPPWGLMAEREGRITTPQGDYYYHWRVLDFLSPQGRAGKLAVLDDITAIKQATRQLDLFFDLSPDAMLVMAPSGAIRHCNAAWKLLCAEAKEGREGTSLWDLLDPFDHCVGQEALLELSRCGGRRASVVSVSGEGRALRWVAVNFVAMVEEQAIYATLRDITPDKNAELQLLAQQELLREQAELLDAVYDSIIVYNAQGEVEYWNMAAESTYGWSRSEAMGKHHHEIFPQGERVREEVHTALRAAGQWRGEQARLRRDGVSIIVECDISVHRHEDGLVDVYLEVSRDITQRAESRTAEERLALLVTQSSNAIISTKRDGSILTWNSAATAMLGYDQDKVQGDNFARVLGGGHQQWDEIFAAVHDGQSPSVMTTELRHQNGASIKAMVTLSPLRHYSHVLYGVVLVVRDLTKETRHAYELFRLDRLNYVGQIAKGIGHELRNPLTTVRGFLQLFARRPELAGYTSHFKLLISEMDRINALLTEFMTLSGGRHIDLVTLQLNDILVALWPALQADAELEDKEVWLELGEVPELVLNEVEIRALVVNLVRNALEASPQGGTVTISTAHIGDTVTLAITDHGGGISAEDVAQIGTPFFTTKKHGTGMGLAVCYAIARTHHATIDFASSDGTTRFNVSFPTTFTTSKYVHI
ncbi:MAG: PAS domain S-box protein [Firmicutes bacterium]|nr:PAS domain S-box protein [Dethiobacter sp.]MBS3888013.1 PAS domain S-box protein [Bacillota bacterium]